MQYLHAPAKGSLAPGTIPPSLHRDWPAIRIGANGHEMRSWVEPSNATWGFVPTGETRVRYGTLLRPVIPGSRLRLGANGHEMRLPPEPRIATWGYAPAGETRARYGALRHPDRSSGWALTDTKFVFQPSRESLPGVTLSENRLVSVIVR